MIAREGHSEGFGDTWAGFAAPCVARVGSSFDVAFSGTAIAGPVGYDGVFVKHAATTTSFPVIEILLTTLDTLTVAGLGTNLDVNLILKAAVPALSQRGDKAFLVTVTGQNKSVLLTKGPLTTDPLAVICYDGMPIPGTQSDLIKVPTAPFGIEAFGTASNLDIGFHATTTTATNGSSGIFRWDAQTSALQVIAHTDGDAPGTSDDFSLIAGISNSQYTAEFGSSVHGAFRASTKNPGTSQRGIWSDDPSNGVTLVRHKGQVAPGTIGNQPFEDFHAPAVNSLSRVAFRGCLNSTCTNDGIWADTTGTLSKVALMSEGAPDATGTGTFGAFETFSNPVLNEYGAIAFQASLSQPGGEGVWRQKSGPGAVLKRVVKKDDFLLGTSLQFASFGQDLAIADTDELAFTATMSDGEQGLFTTFQLGSGYRIVKIAKEGEAFTWDQQAMEMRTIADILFYPGAYAMGTTGFVHMKAQPAQPQGIGFVVKLDPTVTDPFQRLALVLTTVE